MIWQLATATGWTTDYIMWNVNYPTLLMMLADAPRYVKIKESGDQRKKPNKSQPQKRTSQQILEYFQTQLKK